MAYQTHQKKLPQTVHRQRERKPAMIIPQPLPPRVISAEVSIPQAHSKPAAPPATVITRSVPNQGTPPSNIRGVTSPRVKNIPVISRAVVPRENTPRLTIKTKKTPNQNPAGVWQYPKISLHPLPSLPRDVPGIIKSPILMVPSTITRNMRIKQETDAVRMQALRKAYALARESYQNNSGVAPDKLREAAAWVDIYNQELAHPSRTLDDLEAVAKNIAESNKQSNATTMQRIRSALGTAWGNGKAIGSDILYYLAAPAISALGHGGAGEAANSVVNRVAFEAANKLIPERYRGIVTLGDVFRKYNPQELLALLPTNIEDKIATALAEGLGDILADIGQDPKGAQLSARSKLLKPTNERKLLLQTMFHDSALPNKNKLAALGMNAMLRAGEHITASLPDAIGPIRINRPQLLRVWNEDITSRFAPETIKFASDLRNAKYEGLRILPAQIPKDNRIQIAIPSLDAAKVPFDTSSGGTWDDWLRYGIVPLNLPPVKYDPDLISLPKNDPNVSIPPENKESAKKGKDYPHGGKFEMVEVGDKTGNDKEDSTDANPEKTNAKSLDEAYASEAANAEREIAEALKALTDKVDGRDLSTRLRDEIQLMNEYHKFKDSDRSDRKPRYEDAKKSVEILKNQYDKAISNWIETRWKHSMNAAKGSDLYKYLPGITLDEPARKMYEDFVGQYHRTRIEQDVRQREYKTNLAYEKARSAMELRDLQRTEAEAEKEYKNRLDAANKYVQSREAWREAYANSILPMLWGYWGKNQIHFDGTSWASAVANNWYKQRHSIDDDPKEIRYAIDRVINLGEAIKDVVKPMMVNKKMDFGKFIAPDQAIQNLNNLISMAKSLYKEDQDYAKGGHPYPNLSDKYTHKSAYDIAHAATVKKQEAHENIENALKAELQTLKKENTDKLNYIKQEITTLLNTAREKNKMNALPEINFTSYLTTDAPKDAPKKEPTFIDTVRTASDKVKDTINNAINSLTNNYKSLADNNPNPETGNMWRKFGTSAVALGAIGTAMGMKNPPSLPDMLGGDRVIPDNAPAMRTYSPITINPRGGRKQDAPIAVVPNTDEANLNKALGDYFAANNPSDPNGWDITDTIRAMLGIQPKRISNENNIGNNGIEMNNMYEENLIDNKNEEEEEILKKSQKLFKSKSESP